MSGHPFFCWRMDKVFFQDETLRGHAAAKPDYLVIFSFFFVLDFFKTYLSCVIITDCLNGRIRLLDPRWQVLLTSIFETFRLCNNALWRSLLEKWSICLEQVSVHSSSRRWWKWTSLLEHSLLFLSCLQLILLSQLDCTSRLLEACLLDCLLWTRRLCD